MTLRDDLMAAVDAARAIPDALGIRTTTVSIVVETYSAAINTTGATITDTDETTLSPVPKVVKLGGERAMFYGGSILEPSTGRGEVAVYQIGPVTHAHALGGYTAADLLPDGSKSKRVMVRLAGDDFEAGGELFEVVAYDASKPFRIMMTVRRTRQ